MKLRHLLITGIVATVASSGFSLADHLLFSEVLVSAPTQAGPLSSEYAEIFNPTNTTVTLTNYYLSDYNASAGNRYWNLPSFVGGRDYGDTDHLVRFPAGASIPPGGVVVVTQNAETFLGDLFTTGALPTYLAQPGSPQLFECVDTTATVANMVNNNTNAVVPGNFNMTNSAAANGEFVVLFYWDGASDLVRDVDLIQWGAPAAGQNRIVTKTTSDVVDGPDAGATGTAYANDNGVMATYTKPTPGALLVRLSSVETGEVATGGNGLTGNDETTENVAVTWSGLASNATRTPGTTTLPFTAPTTDAKDWQLFN